MFVSSLLGKLYYCRLVDIFIIFMVFAGFLSAMSNMDRKIGLWNFISCHTCLLAYSMVRRQHWDIDKLGEVYDGYNFFLISKI